MEGQQHGCRSGESGGDGDEVGAPGPAGRDHPPDEAGGRSARRGTRGRRCGSGRADHHRGDEEQQCANGGQLGYRAQVPTTSALAADLRTPTRWPALDGVRGLAVVSVVLYHAYRLVVLGDADPASRDLDPLTWPLSTARFALDAFFVLSGLLIVASWTALRRRHDVMFRLRFVPARSPRGPGSPQDPAPALTRRT